MRILYFLENNWVFGKIFNELIKFLHPDIDGDILCWSQKYSSEETNLLKDKYDLYYSTPVGCFFLHEAYGWPLEKCFAQAHSEYDIADALHRFPRDYFNKLAGYAAVSAPIAAASDAYNLSRHPLLLPVGVTTANYARRPSSSIRRLGYFGRVTRTDHGQPDIKRGHLASFVAMQTGLEFYQRDKLHFLAADQLYRDVDLVIFCSTTEGNPYVALEAAAAGVPILGTPVGIFPELAAQGCGFVLPFDEDQFVATATEAIRSLQREPELYKQISERAVSVSRSFDWSVIAPLWSRVLRGVAKDGFSRKDSHVSQIDKEEESYRAAFGSTY